MIKIVPVCENSDPHLCQAVTQSPLGNQTSSVSSINSQSHNKVAEVTGVTRSAAEARALVTKKRSRRIIPRFKSVQTVTLYHLGPQVSHYQNSPRTVPSYCHISSHSLHYFLQSKQGLNLKSKEEGPPSNHTRKVLTALGNIRSPELLSPWAPHKMTHVLHEDILAGSI